MTQLSGVIFAPTGNVAVGCNCTGETSAGRYGIRGCRAGHQRGDPRLRKRDPRHAERDRKLKNREKK